MPKITVTMKCARILFQYGGLIRAVYGGNKMIRRTQNLRQRNMGLGMDVSQISPKLVRHIPMMIYGSTGIAVTMIIFIRSNPQ